MLRPRGRGTSRLDYVPALRARADPLITTGGCRASSPSPITARAARLGLFIQLPHPVLWLLAGTLEPVEHLDGRIDLVAVLPLGSIISSCKYSASQASSFGRWTKPFSITAV